MAAVLYYHEPYSYLKTRIFNPSFKLVNRTMKILLLSVAVTAAFVSYAQTPVPVSNGKVGYASVEYIMSQLPEMKEIESDMKAAQTQLRNQIQVKSQEVQKQYESFNANAASMADTVRENRQQELEQSFAELEKMQQDAQAALQNRQKLYMAPLYLKVNKTIREVAVENGFEIILTDRVSGFDFLLFSSNQFDISPLVLQKLGVTAPPDK